MNNPVLGQLVGNMAGIKRPQRPRQTTPMNMQGAMMQHMGIKLPQQRRPMQSVQPMTMQQRIARMLMGGR